jgi:hypothetical protein
MLERLNGILSSVCDTDVNLYFILMAGVPEYHEYDMPPFRLGRLRREKLKYSCEKAGSDFYDRYREMLVEAWAVEREPMKARVFDIPRVRRSIFVNPNFGQTRQLWESRAWEALVDGYFSFQNQALFNLFWSEVVSVQDPLLALGAPFVDLRRLRSIIQYHQVAVFLNLGPDRKGFVAPAVPGWLEIDLTNAHERIPKLRRELKQEYGFDHFDNSALHGTIKLFAMFVARGRRHQIDGNPDEALLHFVIALELIFGERQAIQKSVSERVAVITFRSAGRSFERQRAWIDQIYDLRSRYVHAGQRIADEKPLDDLYILCQQVFRCLLRLQAAHPPLERRKETMDRWLALLDYLAKGMMAGKTPDHNQFIEAFVE